MFVSNDSILKEPDPVQCVIVVHFQSGDEHSHNYHFCEIIVSRKCYDVFKFSVLT